MRFIAMALVLVSLLMVAPKVELGTKSAEVTPPGFVPSHISAAAIEAMTAPGLSVAMAMDVDMAMPARHGTPLSAKLPAFDPKPAVLPDGGNPMEGPSVTVIARAETIPTYIRTDTPAEPAPEVTRATSLGPEGDLPVIDIDGRAPMPMADADTVQADATDIAETDAEVAAALPEIDLHRVTGSRVNVRSGPSSRFGVVTVATEGQQAEVIGEEGSWIQIRFVDSGDEGWIFGRYLAPMDGA